MNKPSGYNYFGKTNEQRTKDNESIEWNKTAYDLHETLKKNRHEKLNK